MLHRISRATQNSQRLWRHQTTKEKKKKRWWWTMVERAKRQNAILQCRNMFRDKMNIRNSEPYSTYSAAAVKTLLVMLPCRSSFYRYPQSPDNNRLQQQFVATPPDSRKKKRKQREKLIIFRLIFRFITIKDGEYVVNWNDLAYRCGAPQITNSMNRKRWVHSPQNRLIASDFEENISGIKWNTCVAYYIFYKWHSAWQNRYRNRVTYRQEWCGPIHGETCCTP